LNILALTKRQYTNKDLIDDKYGRIRELLRGLGLSGYKIQGLCLSYKNKPEGFFKDETIEWYSLNIAFFKITGLIRFLYNANKMAHQSDLIFASSDSIYAIIGFIIARLRKVPIIIDLYDNYEYFLMGRLPLVKQLFHWAVRKCDAVICASKPLADRIQSIRKRPGVTVIENATDPEMFKPMNKINCRRSLGLPEQGTFIGTAGAIHINRGSDTLFDAFDRLKNEIPGLRLILAGNWDRSIPTKDDDRIHYLGKLPLSQVPLLINSLDVAVICNADNEFGRYCFPQKAYEILACKIPLAVADVGSMSEMFNDVPHHLYKPHDAESLIQCIRYNLKKREIPHLKPRTWKHSSKTMSQVIQQVVSSQ
jgi:teichuronic acid biosynthesis glycosyltransferase TuaC